MGSFYTSCIVQNHTDRSRMVAVPEVLVDTGSEHTWIPSSALEQIGILPEKKLLYLILANGQRVDRKSTRLNSSHIQKSRMPSSA